MPTPLSVHLLPRLLDEHQLPGATAIVIDVLRASTTIVHALAAGARRVIPCREVDEARSIASALPPGEAVLGGERGGVRIEGFDLGNSPSEFTPPSVGGKMLVFTTTNGTQALAVCRQASRVVIGAVVNAAAVVRAVEPGVPLHLVCAGTRGEITREDTLLAGYLVDRLLARETNEYRLNDSAAIAHQVWRAALGDVAETTNRRVIQGRWTAALAHSQGGRNLTALGLQADIADAAKLDRFDLVPTLDPNDGNLGLP